MHKNRTAYLDVFRGGASMCIILYHLTSRYDQMIGHLGNYPFNLPWGWMAWSVFFVLTGFLVMPKSEGLIDFVKGKVVRLYPGYWAAMIVCFIVTRLALPEMAVSIKDFCIDLTMLGNFLGRASVVGVDWTLSINLIYYAFIAVIMLIKKTTEKDWFVEAALVWTIVACMISILQNCGVTNSIVKFAGILIAANYAHLFFTGILLRKVAMGGERIGKYYIGIVLMLVDHWIVFENIGFEVFFVVFVAIFIGCLKMSKNTNQLWIRLSKPLVFIAGISYPLYLCHEYVGFAIIKNVEIIGFTSELVLIPCIAIAMFLAWCIHQFIEKPATKLLKKS